MCLSKGSVRSAQDEIRRLRFFSSTLWVENGLLLQSALR